MLDLASNCLTGRIESILGGLPVLKELRVNNNFLTGGMPAQFMSSHIEVSQSKISCPSACLSDVKVKSQFLSHHRKAKLHEHLPVLLKIFTPVLAVSHTLKVNA